MWAIAFAQSDADVLRFSRTLPLGTARSAAMSGAFGALGGDISTLNVNPALRIRRGVRGNGRFKRPWRRCDKGRGQCAVAWESDSENRGDLRRLHTALHKVGSHCKKPIDFDEKLAK